MRLRTTAALAAITLLPLAACAGGATTTELGAVEVRVPSDAAYAVEVDTDVGTSTVSVRKDPASAHRIRISTQVCAASIEPLP
jgi:hypothetical protein